MISRIALLAIVLSLGLLVAPGAVPGLSPLSVAEDAEAKPCVIGDDPGCLIPIVCIRDCDGDPSDP